MNQKLQQLRQEIKNQNNWDQVVDSPMMIGRFLSFNNKLAEVSKEALEDISRHLDLPSEYLNRCPAELISQNVNCWLDYRGNKKFLLRGHEDVIDAILTEKYIPFDNENIMDVINKSLKDVNEDQLVVDTVSLTRHAFHLRIMNKEHKMELKTVGDEILSGVGITNGETGRAPLAISPIVYRKVCSNGLVIPVEGEVGMRHVHKSSPSLEKIDQIKSEIRRLILEKDESFTFMADLMRHGEEVRFSPIDCEHCKKSDLRGKIALMIGTENADAIIDGFQGDSVTSFVNHLTYVAQEYTFSQRFQLEKYAGKFLLNHR